VLAGEAASHLEPIHVRKHDVEHEHVRTPLPDPRDRSCASLLGVDGEAVVTQRHRQDIDDIRLVVDDQHAERLLLLHHRRRLSARFLGVS
jgi:hypothetical protein